MNNTALNIEDYFYGIIKNSALSGKVNGGVYRDGYRPIDSQLEDIIIIYVTGTSDYVQKGIVNVNIYVPDIQLSTAKPNNAVRFVANKSRLKVIEAAANDFINNHTDGNYLLELGSIIQSFKDMDINQHFVSVKIKYTLLNN